MGESFIKKIVFISLFVICFLSFSFAVLAATHSQYSTFSSAENGFVFNNISNLISVSDTAIYRTGYYSIGGNDWVSFNLSGSSYNGNANWLRSYASRSLPDFGEGEHYIIVYSCSYNSTNSSWDCHDGKWQLIIFAKSAAGTRYLVRDGVAVADIVVASNAPNMVKLAGNYLQKYIYNMTGATLTISNTANSSFDFHIYIGESNYTQLMGINSDGCVNDGFKMVSGENYLVLIGDDAPFEIKGPMTYSEWDALTGHKWTNEYIDYYGRKLQSNYNIWETDGRGSLNAVFEFLYNQGMRWYYPNEIGTITPEKTDVSFQDVNSLVNPDFPMRHIWIYYHEWGELNTYFYPNPLFENQFSWHTSLRSNSYYEFMVGSVGGMAHGLSAVIGRLETESAHPEYYAIWDGVRMNGSIPKPDLCSQGLFDETVSYAKAMFDLYNVSTVSVMPVDSFIYASESSPECKARETPERGVWGSISDYVWEFTNNIAWEIYNDPKYAGKKIINDAYGGYTLPPVNLSKPLAPNLVIVTSNGRLSFKDETSKEFWRDIANQWLEILPSKEFYTYDIYNENTPGSGTQSIPFLIPHIISEDMKYLNGKSKGESMEVYADYPELNLDWDPFAATALNIYVIARMQWDADQDIDTLLNEYYDLFYGPASSQMKTFVEYSETHDPIGDYKAQKTMREMLLNARAVAGNTVYGQRIDLLLDLMNSNFDGDEILTNSCRVLDSPTSTYKLTSDVSSTGTCFTLETYAVTIDCQGHTITYNIGNTNEQYGIYASGDWWKKALTIKNCNIVNGGSTATQGLRTERGFSGVNIVDSTLRNGFWLIDTWDVNVTRSNIGGFFTQTVHGGIVTDSNLSSISSSGLYLYNTDNFIVARNNISSVSGFGGSLLLTTQSYFEDNNFTSDTGDALSIVTSSYNNFTRNSASSGARYGMVIGGGANNSNFEHQTASGGIYGVVLSNAPDNAFRDCGTISGGTQNVYISNSPNTIFVNCNY